MFLEKVQVWRLCLLYTSQNQSIHPRLILIDKIQVVRPRYCCYKHTLTHLHTDHPSYVLG